MVVLSCGCDVDANAITMCRRDYDQFIKSGVLVFIPREHEKIRSSVRRIVKW